MSICQRMTTRWRARCIRLIGNIVEFNIARGCRIAKDHSIVSYVKRSVISNTISPQIINYLLTHMRNLDVYGVKAEIVSLTVGW